MLQHVVVGGTQLQETDARDVLQHLADLWGYDVSLAEVDAGNAVLKEYMVKPRSIAAVA
jgi:spore cortex formation protein SpoVR/YcgB (stage V sporulation)